MSGFYANGENFNRLFMTQHQFAERFLGNQLYTWGQGTAGMLANNTATSRSSPGDVITAAKSNNWNKIVGGFRGVAALKSDGSLWSWGDNQYGQIGDNTTINKSSPVTVAGGGVWRTVTGGTPHLAIKNDGTLWGWGANSFGGIGDGTTANRSSPVTVAGGGNWVNVFSSIYTTFGIQVDGSLWGWGDNIYGKLGYSNIASGYSSPVSVINGIYDWSQISISGDSILGLRNDGSMWNWGKNDYGQLGDGTTVNKSSPVTIAGGGTTWKMIAAGVQTSFAIKTDGTLWSWGRGTFGVLGNNTTTNRSSPGTVAGGGTTWKMVASDEGTLCAGAIKTDGTLWRWGSNSNGEIGDNTTVNKSSPVSITTGITNWISVASYSPTSGSTVAGLANIG